MPALVDPEVFERAQAQLQRNLALAWRRCHQDREYLLRGLLRCTCCGLRISARTTSSAKSRYVCASRISPLQAGQEARCTLPYLEAPVLDRVVWDDIVAVLTDPDAIIQEALESAPGAELGFGEELARVEGALAKLQTESRRLLDAYQVGLIELPELEARRRRLEASMKTLSQDQAAIQKALADQRQTKWLAEDFARTCAAYAAKLTEMPFAERQRLARLLIEEVTVTTDCTVEIRYAIPVSRHMHLHPHGARNGMCWSTCPKSSSRCWPANSTGPGGSRRWRLQRTSCGNWRQRWRPITQAPVPACWKGWRRPSR